MTRKSQTAECERIEGKSKLENGRHQNMKYDRKHVIYQRLQRISIATTVNEAKKQREKEIKQSCSDRNMDMMLQSRNA